MTDDSNKKTSLEALVSAAESASEYAEAAFAQRSARDFIELATNALDAATRALQFAASCKDQMSPSLRERVFGKATE